MDGCSGVGCSHYAEAQESIALVFELSDLRWRLAGIPPVLVAVRQHVEARMAAVEARLDQLEGQGM